MLVVKQGIYEIRNTENGAVYVGQSVDTAVRMQGHQKQLAGDRHPNKLLQEEWNDYGGEVFTFEHVETVYREALLLSKERERIRDYEKNGVNLYNRTGVHGIRRKPPGKTILFNPFQEYRKAPLVLKYLTFKDRPAPPEEPASEPVVKEPKKPKPAKKKKAKQKIKQKKVVKLEKLTYKQMAALTRARRVMALKENYPIGPPKMGRGCPHHSGIICWHMVLYGGVGKQYEGMTFEEYDEARG